MPGVTLPNSGITLPVLGGDPGVWDDETNACWANYDGHDHSAGKCPRIRTASINIDADLGLNGKGLTAIGRLAFSKIAALTTGTVTLFVNAADNELYYRTQGGVNVKLTNGTSINTTLIGGIAGDYAAVGAEVAYDDANDVYTFKQEGSPRPWARIAAGDVRIYQYNTTETVYTGIKVAAALAASYDITLPLALPASTKPVAMDSTGQLLLGKAFAMDVDEGIAISGVANYKHGTKTINRPIKSAETYGGVLSNAPPGGLLDPAQTVYIPLPDLPKHARLLAVRLYYGSIADAAACTAKLYKTSDAVPVVAGFTDLSVTLTPGGTSIASTTGLTFQYANAGSYWIQVTNTTGGERVSAVGIDYDVP